MKPPPRDEDDKVVPHDHEDIHDHDYLIRRIDPSQHVVSDENLGCLRVSTKAFQPSSGVSDGMSVDIEKLIVGAGFHPGEYVTDPKHLGSVMFKAGAARVVDLHVGFDPIPENPYHGEVWGTNRPNRFSKTQQKAIFNASNWLVEIPEVKLILP